MGTLQKIQQRIIDRDYLMSSHVEEEMVDSLKNIWGQNIWGQSKNIWLIFRSTGA